MRQSTQISKLCVGTLKGIFMAKNNHPRKTDSENIQHENTAKKRSIPRFGKRKNQTSEKAIQKKNIKKTVKPKAEKKAPQQAAVYKPKPKQPLQERKTTPLRIIALGGLNEIGKNIYVYECANEIGRAHV